MISFSYSTYKRRKPGKEIWTSKEDTRRCIDFSTKVEYSNGFAIPSNPNSSVISPTTSLSKHYTAGLFHCANLIALVWFLHFSECQGMWNSLIFVFNMFLPFTFCNIFTDFQCISVSIYHSIFYTISNLHQLNCYDQNGQESSISSDVQVCITYIWYALVWFENLIPCEEPDAEHLWKS